MSLVVDIANAIVQSLNEGIFSRPFTAVRVYRPSFALEELKDLHVTVVPKTLTSQASDRVTSQQDVEIDIAIQQQAGDDQAIDDLMGLVEEIADYFRQNRQLPGVGAWWVKTENNPIYAPDQLQQLHVFTSLLTVTFRTLR